MMKKFINIADINKKELRLILDNAKTRKEKRSTLKRNAKTSTVEMTLLLS